MSYAELVHRIVAKQLYHHLVPLLHPPWVTVTEQRRYVKEEALKADNTADADFYTTDAIKTHQVFSEGNNDDLVNSRIDEH